MKAKLTLAALLVGTALAVAPVAGAKVMIDGDNGGSGTPVPTYKPSGMSNAEYRALVIRGTALNAHYGHAAKQSPQPFKPPAMSAAEYRALVIWGQALNAIYGNHITDLSPQQFKKAFDEGIARANGVAPAASASGTAVDSSGSVFDWNDAAIAFAAALLLALAVVGVTRRRHRLSV